MAEVAAVDTSPLIFLGRVDLLHLLQIEAPEIVVPEPVWLEVTGTLGLVLRASRRGLVTDPRAVLERLRAGGMWLSDSVLEGALRTLEQTR